MKNPSVSVIIPVWNRGAQVQRTLDSALSQSLAPLEVIVVDDGSTDGTPDWIEAHYGQRVRLIRQANGGVARARNRGLAEARGEFIAFLDHDDWWLPDKLRLQCDKMVKKPRVGVVYCDWLAVDEGGQPMPRVFQHSQQSWWRPKQGRAFPWILMPHVGEMLRNPITSMSYPLIRAQTLRKIGGFDAAIVPSDDWDLWIRLAKVTRFAFVPRVLVHYVHHDEQQHTDMKRAYRSWLEICRKHPISLRQYPLVWLKQWWFRRFCRALLLYEDAVSAVAQGNLRALTRFHFNCLLLRPDVALYRRWFGLWSRALERHAKP